MSTDPKEFENLSEAEQEVIDRLRGYGWCVVLFCPNELEGVDADRLAEGLVEDGYERIGYLKEGA